jgi:general secretion pathway protein D
MAPPAPATDLAPPSVPPETAGLVAKGRGQYLAGDSAGARETFRQVEACSPGNATARDFLARLALPGTGSDVAHREQTRAQLLTEVADSWRRPGLGPAPAGEEAGDEDAAPLLDKLTAIRIPEINFSGVELSRVINTLGTVAQDCDPSGELPKGVNLVLLDPAAKNPPVSITLRNLSLKRVLDLITDSVGYQYEVQADAIIVRPGGEISTLETEFFPVTRATVLRMTGGGAAADTKGAGDAPAAGGGATQVLRTFLQQAGVNFDGVPGSSLAYDGSAVIVTQTLRNLARIRNILNRYSEVRQVEIEAKFMEVQEGSLDELGVDWNVSRRGVAQFDPQTGAPLLDSSGRQVFTPQETYTTTGVNRSLASTFANTSSSQNLVITGAGGTTLPVAPPALPGAVQLGSAGAAFASITGFVGEFDVQAVVRALSQKQGTDLLSAPKVTVLSGNPANIVVAQELRYPQSFGETQSQVGTGSASGGGSAGVAITAGTPRDFTTRNVGVELKVTPTAEEDDRSISLDLNPKVTEFDGFVEYGGTSVAIAGGNTVTVPSGFFQPIFSVREVATRVTLWDGATLVMGGLTREDVKKVRDQVPVLGRLPLLGRLFRSEGESSQKRNLLIFVTANLVSPGGSPKRQNFNQVPPGALFQNPTIITPRGAETRHPGP